MNDKLLATAAGVTAYAFTDKIPGITKVPPAARAVVGAGIAWYCHNKQGALYAVGTGAGVGVALDGVFSMLGA